VDDINVTADADDVVVVAAAKMQLFLRRRQQITLQMINAKASAKIRRHFHSAKWQLLLLLQLTLQIEKYFKMLAKPTPASFF